MSNAINVIFHLLEARFGLQPAGVTSIALLIVLLLALLSLFLFAKLRSARGIIHQLAQRLGYLPPFSDDPGIFDELSPKEIFERDNEVKIMRLEQRIAELEAEANSKDANLAALQQRAKGLEDQLRQATLRNDEITTQAGEHAKAYLLTADQLEQRMREMEAESNANRAALQERAKYLEDQLQQAAIRNDQLTAQAVEQAQVHRAAAEQLEKRIREMEGSSSANLAALQLRAKELEDRLQQATFRNDKITAQAHEQAQAHRVAIGQLEDRIRAIEAESSASMSAHDQRARELEGQLEQAARHHDEVAAQASEQVQAHRATAEQLELRIRELEAQSNANLAALQQHASDLENQLHQAAQCATPDEPEVGNGHDAASTSEALLRRADWITARTVGAILPHGLVAAEAYAAAAMATDPRNADAPQLLVELARIRRAYPEGLPTVIDALTSFDERAAGFFETDPALAADIAEIEAQKRYRAGMNRSALLAVNMALELRRQSDAEDSPSILSLQELQASLLARLGNHGNAPEATPNFASS